MAAFNEKSRVELRESAAYVAKVTDGEARHLASLAVDALIELERVEGQLDVVRAERDQARADLEALRASLKPTFLSPIAAERFEADLVVWGLERKVIAHVLTDTAFPTDLLADLRAAMDQAEKIGGAS